MDGGRLGLVLALHAVGVGMLGISGWLGGEMVYRNHIGMIPEDAEAERDQQVRHGAAPGSGARARDHGGGEHQARAAAADEGRIEAAGGGAEGRAARALAAGVEAGEAAGRGGEAGAAAEVAEHQRADAETQVVERGHAGAEVHQDVARHAGQRAAGRRVGGEAGTGHAAQRVAHGPVEVAHVGRHVGAAAQQQAGGKDAQQADADRHLPAKAGQRQQGDNIGQPWFQAGQGGGNAGVDQR